MRRNKYVLLLLSIVLMLTMVGCNGPQESTNESDESVTEVMEVNGNQETDAQNGVSESEEVKDYEEEWLEIDPEALGVDELGKVMVLMYHHIREPEAEWSRSPENFRQDLENLYQQGYRPLRLEDYATGNITTPPGKTPVILTFDDGNQNNFNMIEDETGEWVIDADSAVGILMDFHESHPDFMPHATFFINGGTPFGQEEWVEYKLNYLVENGMDIGNHTATHLHLGEADAETLQRELGRIVQLVKEYVPNYEVNTFALPFGSRPNDEALWSYLVSGEYEDVNYHHVAVLEVGWDPYHSPHHESFDGSRIRRVRASETKVDGVGMYDWMSTFENGSRRRYISDGNPYVVTIPEERVDHLSSDVSEERKRTY